MIRWQEYLSLYGGNAVISIGHYTSHFVKRIKIQLDQDAFIPIRTIRFKKNYASKLAELFLPAMVSTFSL